MYCIAHATFTCMYANTHTHTQTHSPLDSRAGSTGTVSPTSSLASSHEDSPPISGSNGPNPNHRRVSWECPNDVDVQEMMIRVNCLVCNNTSLYVYVVGTIVYW